MCFNNLLKAMIITFITISWTIWNNVDFVFYLKKLYSIF
jgi:hypothetical protein